MKTLISTKLTFRIQLKALKKVVLLGSQEDVRVEKMWNLNTS